MYYQCNFFGFIILYAVMVCVACSQLEKLAAKLCDIKHNSFMSDDGAIGKGDNNEIGGLVSTRTIQATLNECVQLHQLIMRYVYAPISPTINTKKTVWFISILVWYHSAVGPIALLQAAKRSPLFHFAISKCPSVLVHCVAGNINMFLLITFTYDTGNDFLRLTDLQHT